MKLNARAYLAPKHWPTWLGIGLLWLISKLPYARNLRVGRGIGSLMYLCLKSRRRTTLINLRLAFPELAELERESLAQESFKQIGMAISEMACTWFKPEDYDYPVEVTGQEYVNSALATGKGVILLQAHFTVLELCAPIITRIWPACGVYDSPKNPLFADFLLQKRSRYVIKMIENKDIRDMVRRLRRGGIVWYSPDQSVAASHGGIATRFFNQAVLTTSGTARMVRMTNAIVIPFTPYRKPQDGSYVFSFHPPIELQTDDLSVATQQVNDLLEAQVRHSPEQYLWAHKRFKPPNPETPSPYQ